MASLKILVVDDDPVTRTLLTKQINIKTTLLKEDMDPEARIRLVLEGLDEK